MKAWIRDLAVALALAFIILQFIKPTIVRENSMEPNLHDGDYIFLSRQSYTFGEPKRGDIVVFHTDLRTETGSEKLLIKRVIGLPGDVIDIEDGLVYLNGEIFEEDYIPPGGTISHDAGSHFEVPEDSLFCMGDNRGVSKDSRYADVGFIEIDDVVGKAWIRLYPFNQITIFK